MLWWCSVGVYGCCAVAAWVLRVMCCVWKAVHTDGCRGRCVVRHDGRCVRKSSHSGRLENAVG